MIYEDSDVMAFLDTDPVQTGATVVIPKKQLEDVWDLDTELFVKIFGLTSRLARRMRRVMNTEGITIFGQSAKPASRGIHHFHILLIPLGKGERKKFAKWWVSAAGRAKRSELDKLAEKLRFR